MFPPPDPSSRAVERTPVAPAPMWWDWVRWALHVPSRVALLVVIAAGVAVSATIGDTRPGDVGGWRGVVLGVSGAAFLVMFLGWRWFWCGRAVRSIRERSS